MFRLFFKLKYIYVYVIYNVVCGKEIKMSMLIIYKFIVSMYYGVIEDKVFIIGVV